MTPKELFSHWDRIRSNLIRTIEMFDESELTYVPFEGCKPAGDIMLHIAEAEAGWISYCAAKFIDHWPDDYNLSNYPDKKSILKLLDEVFIRSKDYLSTLTEADLKSDITAPWGEDFSLYWIFWHIIEHEIHHRGELSLILGYLGREGVFG